MINNRIFNISTTSATIDPTSATTTVNEKDQSFVDLLYNQIILTPSSIDVGNLTGSFVQNVQLWNATNEARTLVSINESGTEGITLTGLDNGTIYANSVLNYQVLVTPEGSQTIDATYTWTFVDIEFNQNLSIVGSRIALLDYDINWNSSNYPKEYYTCLTDISTSYNGYEQRVNISEGSRLAFEYFYTLNEKDRISFENLIYLSQDSSFQVPIYYQKTELLQAATAGNNTAEIDISNTMLQVGSTVMVKDNTNFDVLKINSIVGTTISFENNFIYDYSIGSVVIPLVLANLNNNIAVNYLTNDVAEMLIRYEVVDSELYNIINLTDNLEIYDDLPLLIRKPSRDITFTKTFERQFYDIDFQAGWRTRVKKDATPAITLSYQFSLFGKDEIAETIALFKNMDGRYNEFYVNSCSNDFILLEDIGLNDTALIVDNNNQLNFNNNVIKSIIRIETKNGDIYIRKILNYLSISNNRLSLSIDSNLGVNLTVDDIANIQFLSNARFNNDTLQIDHISDEYAEINIDVRILRNVQ